MKYLNIDLILLINLKNKLTKVVDKQSRVCYYNIVVRVKHRNKIPSVAKGKNIGYIVIKSHNN